MAKPQIFNRDMKRLAYLDNALAVGYGLETNSLWTATFTLPADDPKNAYCTPLNFVEIFDGDERIDLFRIIGEDMERSNGATRYYDCEHVLATLLSDVLFQYHQCGGSGVKTADVLNYILARQTRQNWKLGACDFKRYFEYNWENSTLLAALFAVPECFDSEYLWSWDTTVYPWTLSLTVPTEALKSEIRYAKNMTNIKKTTDATSIANRVYALGYGEGVNQLTIESANGGVPYVEDALSIERYGLCSTILVDSRYQVAENLKAYAEQILAGLKEPYVGQTAIVSGEIAEDITNYFAVSEQTPSVCALGVLVNPDLTVQCAGGFLIQLLPGCPEETISAIETAIDSIPPVTTMLAQGLTVDEIAAKAMGTLKIDKLDEYPIAYRCNCNRERVETALLTAGEEELRQMIDAGEDIQVECHFCDKTYSFTPEQLNDLLKKSK